MAPVILSPSLVQNGTNLAITDIISHLQNGHHIRDVEEIETQNTTIATSANTDNPSCGCGRLPAGAIAGSLG